MDCCCTIEGGNLYAHVQKIDFEVFGQWCHGLHTAQFSSNSSVPISISHKTDIKSDRESLRWSHLTPQKTQVWYDLEAN